MSDIPDSTPDRGRPRRVTPPPVWPGLPGGRYQPLTPAELERMHQAVLDVLETIGFADAPDSMIERVTEAGGLLGDDGRLRYPRTLVEDVLARAPRTFVLPGQDPRHDMEVGGGRVYMGTGGAAPLMLDFDSGRHRETTALDLYDIARLVDGLEHIDFFWRTVVAGDMPSPLALDLNTTYACMAGTLKHVGVSLANGDHVRTAIALMELRLGGAGEFRRRPFCSLSCCHVVSPLRFALNSCDALEAAVRAGMPVALISAAQAGATSPVTLAGSIVQAMAECIAGLVFAVMLDPACRVSLGTWPLVSDLRTGAMSAGSAELALMAAGSAQLASFYGLPGSVAGGMTDAKVPDAQSGAEKATTLALAAHAGPALILESAGMQASLMSTALESYVIDDDLLASVQRTLRGIEVSDETLSVEVIRETVAGDGHFLGHPQTHERMKRDYFYPAVGDRSSPSAWESAGGADVRERARRRVREVLRTHYPEHIDDATDARIRETFDIRIPRQAMRPGNGRW